MTGRWSLVLLMLAASFTASGGKAIRHSTGVPSTYIVVLRDNDSSRFAEAVATRCRKVSLPRRGRRRAAAGSAGVPPAEQAASSPPGSREILGSKTLPAPAP
jgi:hypothetical protein